MPDHYLISTRSGSIAVELIDNHWLIHMIHPSVHKLHAVCTT